MEGIKAVIFDMDGVIIDSEPLWRKAMIEGFTGIGISFTEKDCTSTTGMRFNEVVNYWFGLHQITSVNSEKFIDRVINNLIELINTEGKPMPGALELFEFLNLKNMPMGIASSSNNVLIQTVIKKLNIGAYFKAVTSAESLPYGKPHPAVFIECAKAIDVRPEDCMAIEDSVNGIISAKAAGMKVIAVPDNNHWHDTRFDIADFKIKSLHDVIKLF